MQAARHQPLRLYPVDVITLQHKAVAHLDLGNALFHMLMHISAFVRDFDYKFRHFLVFLPLFWMGKPTPKSTIRSHYSKRQTTPSNLIDVPQVTSSRGRLSIVQPALHDFSSRKSPKVKAPVRDGHIFLLISEPILGRRPVYSLNDEPSDVAFWRHLKHDFVDLVRERRRNAPHHHISCRQRLDIRRQRQPTQL